MVSDVRSLWKRCTAGKAVKQSGFSWLLALVICFQGAMSHAQGQSEGKKLYFTYCTGCHGSSGRGDGPAAKTLSVNRPIIQTAQL